MRGIYIRPWKPGHAPRFTRVSPKHCPTTALARPTGLFPILSCHIQRHVDAFYVPILLVMDILAMDTRGLPATISTRISDRRVHDEPWIARP